MKAGRNRDAWPVFVAIFVLAPILTVLPAWIGLLLLLRVLARFGPRGDFFASTRLIKLAVMTGGLAAWWVSYDNVIQIDAVLALTAVLTVTYFLGPNNAFDRRFLSLLCLFLLLGHVLSRPTWVSFLHMLAGLFLVISLLLQTSAMRETRERILKKTFVLFLQASPLILFFILSFPRLDRNFGHLWGRRAQGAVGFSDKLRPGEILSLVGNSRPAFRVKFNDASHKPAPRELYWRGLALWDTDGLNWSNATELAPAAKTGDALGEAVLQEITLEPHLRRILFALEVPQSLTVNGDEARVKILEANVFRSSAIVAERLRYEAVSRTAPAWPEILTAPATAEGNHPTIDTVTRERALKLPEDLSPELSQLMRSLSSSASARPVSTATPERLIAATLAYFGTQGFSYSLDLDRGVGNLGEFLFETQKGFCGHYASAFAVLMRLAGIPARVVVGYQGGTYNPLGGYWIVRQQNAHAWAEAWLDGKGWVRVDPTLVVAPERIEEGQALQVLLSDSIVARALRRVLLVWDGIGFETRDLIGPERSWQKLFSIRKWLGQIQNSLGSAALIAGAVAVSLFLLSRLRGLSLDGRSQRHQDEILKTYLLLCQALRRAGAAKAPGEGPADYAKRVRETFPKAAVILEETFRLYIGLRYSNVAVSRARDYRLFKKSVREACRLLK